MMKRLVDFICSTLGLLILSPIILAAILAVWLQDFKSPFYIAPRVGKGGKTFPMVKLRSMVVNADKSGVDSTSSNDRRITKIGQIIRSYKLDEIMQLWNVFLGDMSLVGPRPNVEREVALYTDVEKKLIKFRPGITDLASIVFSDEGEILRDSKDPDIDYHQLIRPWKSQLALIGVENPSILLDCKIIFLTLLSVVSRESALIQVNKILIGLNANEQLLTMARRQTGLLRSPPPGATEIVTSR